MSDSGLGMSLQRCSYCLRSHTALQPINFEAVVEVWQREAYWVCEHCYLCQEIRKLGIGGYVSTQTQLETLQALRYILYRGLKHGFSILGMVIGMAAWP